MTLRIAITRSAPEAEGTAERVRARGAEPILAPLLHIETRAFDTNVSQVQAILFSSANGVRAFATASSDRAPAILAVGDATQAAARRAGFADVRSANGDVRALVVLAKATLATSSGKLVHISGAHAAGDLSGALMRAGFIVERRVAYEAVAATAPPLGLASPLDLVLFHSARAAQIFARLGVPGAEKMVAGCLSQATADAAAASTRWARIIVAPRPREDALLDATLGGQISPTGASA
jgi:uroporphyrinogen-III synthase